jgi:hypothetical protein
MKITPSNCHETMLNLLIEAIEKICDEETVKKIHKEYYTQCSKVINEEQS